jgi:hypothetical protein
MTAAITFARKNALQSQNGRCVHGCVHADQRVVENSQAPSRNQSKMLMYLDALLSSTKKTGADNAPSSTDSPTTSTWVTLGHWAFLEHRYPCRTSSRGIAAPSIPSDRIRSLGSSDLARRLSSGRYTERSVGSGI